ncbi:MAG: tetratricopeptide (TPR) repeat protein, partial [Planctomycetota bacterium]
MQAWSAGFVLCALMSPVAAQQAKLVSGKAIDVVVGGGKGPRAALFSYRLEKTGAVFISAWSDVVDPRLRILGGGDRVLGEDSDSGGGTTAFLRLNVTAGSELTIDVASENGTAAGAVTVFLRELPAPSGEARGRLNEARALFAKAQTLKAQGSYEDARAQMSAALDVLLAGSDEALFDDAAMLLEQLAIVAFNLLQDVPQAYRAFAAALEWSRAHYPPTHSAHHSCLQNVAGMLMKLGRAKEAYPIAVEAWQGRVRSLGPDHVDTLYTRTNVAVTLHGLRRKVEAEEHFRAIYESYSQNLDPEDSRVAMAARNLGSLRLELGDVRGAYELIRRAHDFMVRTLPEEHPDRQSVRSNLARVLSALGDREGALVLEEEVYEVFQRTLPGDSLDLQLIRQNLALSRRNTGDNLGALELEEQVYEVRKRVLPAGHRDILSAQSNMAITRLALGDKLGAYAIFQE